MSDALAEAFGVGTDEMLSPIELEQRIRHAANLLKQAMDEHGKACDEHADAKKVYGRKYTQARIMIRREQPDLRKDDLDDEAKWRCIDEWERLVDAEEGEHKWRHRKQALSRILDSFEEHQRYLVKVIAR